MSVCAGTTPTSGSRLAMECGCMDGLETDGECQGQTGELRETKMPQSTEVIKTSSQANGLNVRKSQI